MTIQLTISTTTGTDIISEDMLNDLSHAVAEQLLDLAQVDTTMPISILSEDFTAKLQIINL